MIPPERKMVVEKSTALRCGANLDQLEPGEQECDHNGCEYFEEAFNPEVNHPPAPVFGGDQMAALTVHQSGCIEERNRDAGDEKQHQQRAGLRSCDKRRLERATISTQPKHESDKEQNLPEATKIDVFVTLAAEPEPQVAKPLLDAQPLAGQRTANNENQRGEEYVHAEPLILRFVAADSRTNIKTCRQP